MSAGVCGCCRRVLPGAEEQGARCRGCRETCRPGEHWDGHEFVRLREEFTQPSLPMAMERKASLAERLGREP